MAIKADLASELYSVALEKLTANEEEWRNYLDVASYTYQYSFADQVLIYAQRPHARAVADYDTWNEKIGRWIHKNKEAITLLDYTGKKIERRFVFDISDTYQKFGKEYKLWQITEEDNDKLYEELENAFGNLKNKENLGQTLISAINNVYEDNIKEYYEELISSTEYSVIKEFNEVKIKGIFENIIKSTLIYEVFTRCDIEPYTYLDKDCFENIKYFDSTLLKYSLGTTCNDLSRTIIKKIKEYANNKTYTFAKENTEEYSIYEERSVEDGTIIQNEEIRNIERGKGSNRGNILKSEGEVPKGTQKSSISNDDSKTGIDTTSKPDARRRNKYGGSSDRKDEEGTEYNREIKARRSDDVGTTNEQYKITSTRNSNEGTDIQLNIFNNEVETKKKVSTFFMPENEKIEKNQFQIKDEGISEDNLKTRYKNNIEAIKIQIICDNEKRIATKEEQEKLAKYVGWGGMPQVFDDKNVSWSKEYKELKSLLTENEYEKARASTLTAFYTPPIVIENIYKTIENFGFKGGNILEPSCGIGNFIGMLPESMKDSMFYGVELDEITGEIAKLLYPKSKIEIKGFEETSFKDNTFDVAIGNVPFGDFKITDSRYDKNNFLIHDYFFAKTIDKVRSSGIIAFITSKGTLDKENENVRKYIAERAKFLGAIRLPNNTFTKSAGTEVTSDIIFLQKREEKIENVDELWIHTTKNEDGISVNNYFLQNPNHVVGKLNTINTRFGKDVACVLEQSDNFKELLNKASENIKGEYKVYEADETYIKPIDIDNIEDKNIRNFSYIIKDNKVYFKENNELNFVDVNATAKLRIKGLIELRESTRLLINLQLNDAPENLIKDEQVRLNFLYDEFNKNYGRINSRANKSVFAEDSSYYLLCSLEILNDKGEFLRKADMFKKRTIQPHKEITHCNSSKEALILSVSEKAKIDLEYMQNLTNKSKEELIEDLKGTIFKLPYSEEYVLADEYLSGNVREKLKVVQNAIHSDENLKINEDYLKQVLPKNIEASEITAKLGSTWIPKEYIEKFMHELLKTPRYRRMDIIVNYSEKTASWNISGKSYDRGNVLAYSTYGTDRINAYKIIEDILNLRNVKIFDNLLDEEGNKVRKLNKKETAIAQSKQEQNNLEKLDELEEPNNYEETNNLEEDSENGPDTIRKILNIKNSKC